MSKGKNSGGRSLVEALLWGVTLLWLAFCLYLSWQTGPETAALSGGVVQFLLPILNKLGLTPDPQRFHMGLRLMAHFGVFFVTGALFAAALEATLPPKPSRSLTVFLLASAVSALIAVAAEVGKLAVQGRHLTWSEAGLNVLGALLGVIAVCLTVRLCAALRARRDRSRAQKTIL